MLKFIKAFAFAQFVIFTIAAQQYDWRADFHYFFDNTEYEGSSFAEPQTMTGIWLMPEGLVTWQDRHSLHAGVDLLKFPEPMKRLTKLIWQYITNTNRPTSNFESDLSRVGNRYRITTISFLKIR